MTVLIIYSSISGNTRSLCEKVFDSLKGDKKIVSVQEARNLDFSSYDKIILGFWCRRGTMDDGTQNILKKIEGKDVYFIGTMSGRPNSDYGDSVYKNAKALCEENNNFKKGLMIWGRPSKELMDRIRNRPAGSGHSMTKEKEERWKEAASHPDENDFKKTVEFFENITDEKDFEIYFEEATRENAEYLLKLQHTAYAQMLDRFKDFASNPGNENFESFLKRFDDIESKFLFIKSSNEILGAIRLTEQKDKPYKKLSTLMIWPKYWGRGVAKKTFELLEKTYENQYWVLNTVMEETKLCRLYESLGYVQLEEKLKVKDGMTIVTYMKNYPDGAEHFKFGFSRR